MWDIDVLALVLPIDWFLSKHFSAYHPNEITLGRIPKKVKSRTMGNGYVKCHMKAARGSLKERKQIFSFPFDVGFIQMEVGINSLAFVGYHFQGLRTTGQS